MKHWEKEFDPSYNVPEIISGTLLDVSWHNNTCPSFSNDNDEVTLWCEHPEFTERELEENYRYCVTLYYDDGRVCWTGNDPDEAIKAYEEIAQVYRRDKSIAQEFTRLLIAEIGADNFLEVVRRNYSDLDSNVCHSHDYCDSNMIMLQAFQNIIGRESDLCEGINFASDTDIYNSAWNIARYLVFSQEAEKIKAEKG